MCPPPTDLAAAKERFREAVEARGDLLVEASPPDPRPPRAQLRGALRPRPAHRPPRRRGPRGGAPRLRARHGVRGPGRHARGPTIAVLLRVRRPARHRPRLRAQHHRHRRPRRRPGRGGPWPRSSAAAWSSWAPRPRRAAAARSSWPGTGAFDGVDAALMVHPAGFDLARMDVIAVQELTADLHRRGRPRRGLPAPGPQRPRRRGARLHQRGRAAPAHPAQRADPRDLHAGGDKPNIVPGPGRTEWMVRSREHPLAAAPQGPGGGLPRGGGRRRRLRGRAPLEATSPTPTCSTTR